MKQKGNEQHQENNFTRTSSQMSDTTPDMSHTTQIIQRKQQKCQPNEKSIKINLKIPRSDNPEICQGTSLQQKTTQKNPARKKVKNRQEKQKIL